MSYANSGIEIAIEAAASQIAARSHTGKNPSQCPARQASASLPLTDSIDWLNLNASVEITGRPMRND
jgi:hypothetical protein